jgi:hypothetical protein
MKKEKIIMKNIVPTVVNDLKRLGWISPDETLYSSLCVR